MDAQLLARRLRRLHGNVSAPELARIYGVEISRDAWRVAGGRLVYFAECSLNPPKIVLNTEAIELTAISGQDRLGEIGRRWFTQTQIAEAVIAHELYHIFTGQSSSPESESAAREFARSFTGIPFSPLQYEAALRQANRKRLSNSSLIAHHSSLVTVLSYGLLPWH